MRKYLYFTATLLFILYSNLSFSQCTTAPAQAWNWAGPSVVSNSNRLFGNRNIVYDEFHNIYTVAQLESGSVTIGGFTVSAHYGVDNILIKQDQNGNVIWAKTFGSSQNDGENSVAKLVCGQNGSIYIAYNCQNLHVNGVFASITNTNAIHIIQFDYNGNYVADLFPAQGSGGISALEYYNGELYFSDGNTIKKRDALGVISTVVTLINTSTIRIWNIKHAPNGDWIINGYFTSPLTYGGVTLNEYYTSPTAISAEFIFRLNSFNNVVYGLRMDGLADFYSGSLGITFDNQSNLLFGGIPQGPLGNGQWRFQNTTMTLDYPTNSAIVIKIDAASGNMLWNRQFRSQVSYTGNMLFLLCNPNNETLVVGSYTNGGVVPYAVCLPDYQNFILKLNANGEKIYFQNFGLGGGSFQSVMALTTWDYCKYFITGKGGDLYTVNNPNYNCLTFPYTGMYFTASFNDYSFEIDGNGIDDDCDGQIDENNPNYQRWFRDVDGDGFGNTINSTFGCSAPAGYVGNSNDCDDNNAQIGYTHWYVDADSDGYGDASDPGIASCNSIAGKVSNNKDCNDNNSAIHPGVVEVCNGIDDDCNGIVDALASESGGKALSFNGNGDIVVVNNSSAIQPGMEMTVECWAKSNTSTWNNYGMMVNKDNSFIIHPDQGLKQVRFYVYTNTISYAIAFSPSPAFDITQWHHYAGSYNGSLGKMYFYVDGELVAQGNNAGGSVNTNGNLYIGYDPCCGGRYLNGSIDEVRLWNIVRSQCEIKQAVNVHLLGNEMGLLAYYDFNNPSATIGGNNTGLSILNDIATGNGAQNGTLLNFNLSGSISNWVTGKTAVPLTWYTDIDNDGFGNSTNSITSFTKPCNTTCIAGDCNDNNPAVYPGAVEVCNGIDDDCDGQVDKTLMNGLKLYMPFEGNANDVSGNNHNGIVFNATLATDRFGTPNSAYHFNGTNARIEISDHPDLRPASLSVSTWVKFNGSTGQQYQAFISKSISTGYFNSYVPAYDNISGQIGAFICNTQSCASTFVSQPINAGWLHYVTTFDDATKVMKIYLNGGLVSTISATLSIFYDSSPLTLGCEYESGVTQYFANADLDDVILFNRALSNSEVSGLYTNGPFLPVSVEICNGVDDDCDGLIDEGFPQYTYYADADGDSYGDPAETLITCATTPPSGYVINNTDCNDNNASVHPGTTEVCNGIDDDCDGQTDEGVTTTFYRDADGDTYGNAAVTTQACSAPSGYVSNSADCNDENAAVHPGATEVCNGIDDDCDGQTDEGVTTTFYRDADGDTYGNAAVTTQACSAPSGYVSNSADCDDDNAAINPGATEVCNGIDDDCDGQTDEGVTTTFYRDADGDTYGNAAVTTQACSAPSGYVSNSADCDDDNAAINPGATEVCNGIDDDCDGLIDEGVQSTFYQDADGDGFGNAAITTQACSAPNGFVNNSSDCNDNNAAVHPGASEVCNGADDDCDGQIDEGVQLTFYRDFDGDGYGNPAITIQACTAPSGYVINNTDCNDNNTSVHPGAAEVCNGIDDDCDGEVDEGGQTTFYRDFDGDGFGNAAITIQGCSAPEGYVNNNTDCNDANGSVHPGATEVCGNSIDDNCNGLVDECPVNCNIIEVSEIEPNNTIASAQNYPGSNFSVYGIINPIGDVDFHKLFVANGGMIYAMIDGSAFPAVDQTMDILTASGSVLASDDDGNTATYGDHSPQILELAVAPGSYYARIKLFSVLKTGQYRLHVMVKPQAAAAITETSSLNDLPSQSQTDLLNYFAGNFSSNSDIDYYSFPAIAGEKIFIAIKNAGASLVAPDGVNTLISTSGNVLLYTIPVTGTYYVKAFGNTGSYLLAIDRPYLFEIPGNGIDDNSNGLVDETETYSRIFYGDNDGDGHGNPDITIQSCTALPGYVADNDDCDDTNPGIYPGAEELCNGIDDNCNGIVDENCAPPVITTGPVTGPYCNGSSFIVGYTVVSGVINPGNVFTAQLSNSAGSFSSPVNIGTLSLTTSGNVFVTIPGGTAPGSAYRIRVISSNPAVTGNDNGTDITINTMIVPGITISASALNICYGASVTFTAATQNAGPSPSFQWKRNGTNINGANSSTYTTNNLTGSISCLVTSFHTCTNPLTSLSNLITINVGGSPIVNETESNNTLATATSLSPPFSVNAAISAIGDNDYFNLGSICSGCTISAYVDNAGFPSGDLVMDLMDNTGAVLASNDEGNDPDLNIHSPILRNIAGSSTGNTYIRVKNFGVNSINPGYTLHVFVRPPEATAVPETSLYNNTPATAQTDPSNYYSGSIHEPGDIDYYSFTATAGELYFALGPSIQVIGPDGATEIASSGKEYLVFNIPVSGTYFIRLTSSSVSAYLLHFAKTTALSPCIYAEICDGIDNDGDGLIDEGVPVFTFYRDADGDGFGNADISIQACSVPPGYINNNTDCDDTKATVYPGATEICNGIDDDCDGQIDEGVQSTFYQDFDGDGYGNAAVHIQTCTAPEGYVSNNSDCNDNDIAKWQSATLYIDADGDGYNTGSAVVCFGATIPSGYSATTNGSDCSDNNPNIHPGATEICNNMDDDCDGLIDESTTGGTVPVINSSSATTFCAGSSVTLTSSEASSYLWSTGETTRSITVNQSGSYSVTVTNIGSCAATSLPINVTVNPLPVIFSMTGTGGYCSGSSGALLALSGSQIGVNYQLKRNGNNLGNSIAGTGNIISFGYQTLTGNYTVTAISATTNCEATMNGNITVTIVSLPVVYFVYGGGCSGSSVALSGSQININYQLRLNGVDIGAPVPGTGNTISFGSQTTAGSYTVMASSAGCTILMNGSAAIYALPTIFNTTGGGSYCSGSSGASISLSGSETGVYYIIYRNDNYFAFFYGTGSAININNIYQQGTYSIKAYRNSSDCSSTMNGNPVITVNPLPVQFSVTGGGNYCAGGNGVPVGLSGSELNINYQLKIRINNTNSYTNVGNAVAGTGQPISFGNQTTTGYYTVTATNSITGCSGLMSSYAHVGAISPPSSTISAYGSTTFCNGSSVLLYTNYSYGNTYLWSTGATTYSISATQSGNYTVTVTNQNGCSATSSPVNVTVIPTATAFSVTGGGNYCAGTAGVAVGLSGSQIGFNYQLRRVLSNNSYNPLTSLSGSGVALNFGNQTAGTYIVVATNAATGNCAVQMNGNTVITINSLPAIFTVTGGGSYCSGGSGLPIGLSGTQNGIRYQLKLNNTATGSPVTGTGSAISFGNQTLAGTYTVTATNTSTSCIINMSGSKTISINSLPVVSIPDVYTVNPGGAANTRFIGYGPSSLTLNANVNGNQSYNYRWRAGSANGQVLGTNASFTISPTTTTTYFLTVTNNSTNCSMTVSKTIQVIDVRCGPNLNRVNVCNPANNTVSCVQQNLVAALLQSGSYLGQCNSPGTRIMKDIPEKSIVKNSLAISEIKLFPNPADQAVNIKLSTGLGEGKISIHVMDSKGNIVKRSEHINNLNGQTIIINTADLASGLYVVMIRDSKGAQSQVKVVIQH